LSLLLENARRKTIRIWAEQAPFDLKDELKKRGYRWSSGDEGRRKAWYVDIDEAKTRRRDRVFETIDLSAGYRFVRADAVGIRPIFGPNLIGFTCA
jgi:hypothetical protein